tara:strand:+ start:15322 stop:16272 length:951 start_codon:yes stop_codon:yes gene_type:complete
MDNLERAAKVIIEKCLDVKSNERVLIITDSERLEIGEVLLQQAKERAKLVKLIEKEIGKMNGEEPSKSITQEMLNYDVVIAPTTKSITHTKARRDACKKGVRVATMPGITKEMMMRCIDIDYDKMSKLIDKVHSVVSNGNKMEVTSNLGTQLNFVVKGRNIIIGKGLIVKSGDYGNLPAGEVHFSPLEKTSNGSYVVDGSQAGLGKIKKLKFKVEKGFVKKIEGNRSKELIKLLDSVKDKNAYGIAECGIGMNEKAIITGKILEDEKVKGTCHIALGNNKSYGGKLDVPLHLDGIIKNPSIFVDNEEIMREGKFRL